LAPNAHALELLGWQDSKKIKNNYELHRWFMPILLHGHLEHLAGNVVAQLYMGSGIEWGIGFGWSAFLYIITGFGGNLLSSVLSPASYGVGASTAVFGLVGFYVSYIFSNFQYMQRIGYGQIIFLVLYTLVLILLNLNVGPGKDDHVDNWGHLGGLITGIIAGFAITEALDARDRGKSDPTPRRFTQEEYKKRLSCCKTWACHYFCWFVLFCWFVTLLTLFYAVVDVDI